MDIYITVSRISELKEHLAQMESYKKTAKYKEAIKDEKFASAFSHYHSQLTDQLDEDEYPITSVFLAIPSLKQIHRFTTEPLQLLNFIYELKPGIWTGEPGHIAPVRYIGFKGLAQAIKELAIINAAVGKPVPYDLWNQPVLEFDVDEYNEPIEIVHEELKNKTDDYTGVVMGNLVIKSGMDAGWDLKTLLGLASRLGIKNLWQLPLVT